MSGSLGCLMYTFSGQTVNWCMLAFQSSMFCFFLMSDSSSSLHKVHNISNSSVLSYLVSFSQHAQRYSVALAILYGTLSSQWRQKWTLIQGLGLVPSVYEVQLYLYDESCCLSHQMSDSYCYSYCVCQGMNKLQLFVTDSQFLFLFCNGYHIVDNLYVLSCRWW